MDYRDVEDPSIYFTLDARDDYKKVLKVISSWFGPLHHGVYLEI